MFLRSMAAYMYTLDLGQDNQLGDLKARDIAQTIMTINSHLEGVIALLKGDIDDIETRVVNLEKLEELFKVQKQAITQTLIAARTESNTIRDVHELLRKQIDNERGDRDQRRRYLDRLLIAVLAFSVAGVMLDLFRVLRRPGQLAQS